MVTGANGFVGHHVVRELVARNCDVVGVSRQADADAAIAGLLDTYLPCDLADLDEARTLPLDDIDAVINLAGLAAVGPSFDQPELYIRVNAGVIDSVCTVARERKLSGLRILAVSSGAVYAAGQEMPLSENAELDPASSPYAASKIEMERRALDHRARGVDCVVVRPFNHIGPGQGSGFLVPDLVLSATTASREGKPMRVGTLGTKRDYTDVRDVARAYVDLAAAPSLEGAVFNVCSGRSVSGSEILELVLSALNLSGLEAEGDPRRIRPTDNPDVVGENNRIAGAIGWRPTIPISRSIGEFVGVSDGALSQRLPHGDFDGGEGASLPRRIE